MINGTQVFSYIDKRMGVTKDGEQFIAVNVLTKDTNKKLNFISKIPDVIDKLSSMNLTKFQDVKLHFDFDRAYNNERHTSYWICEVVGVG